MATHPAFGPLGAFISRGRTPADTAALAGELEAMGYGAIWIGGGGHPGVFEQVELLLQATAQVSVATGVVNMWVETPESVTAAWNRLEKAFPGRLFVGLGISHAPFVQNSLKESYDRPLARTRLFLDDLDAMESPLPPERRMLGALGPKMLELAGQRTLGSHPYLVTPQNTAAARAALGDRFLAPELGVILEPDLAIARSLAREALSLYFDLPNYTRNWLRSGFTEDDLAGGGSDRLIDSVVAVGDLEAIGTRIQEHRDAGADHVALQVLGRGAGVAQTFRELRSLA